MPELLHAARPASRHPGRALGWHLIPLVAGLVAAGSLIVLIRRISAAQQERIALGAPAWPVRPGWPAPGAPLRYAHPAQPVIGPSPQPVAEPSVAPPQPAGPAVAPPQAAAEPTAAPPQVSPGAGGTIEA